MTIKQFVEKAIEGGWGPYYYRDLYKDGSSETAAMLLDPLAWQAVGKVEVEKWGETAFDGTVGDTVPVWRVNMHKMIDALAEGKSIEDFLSELS